MKAQSENDLKAIASSILGLTGLSLLLARSSSTEIQGMPWWGLTVLGMLCFTLSLFGQMSFAIKMPGRSEATVHAFSGIVLVLLAGMALNNTNYLQATIMLAVGLPQLLSIVDLAGKNLQNVYGLRIIMLVAGFVSGLILIFTDHILSGILFFATTICGLVSILLPITKFSDLLFRVQAISWLAWCGILISRGSLADLIAPGMMAASILLAGRMPWNRIVLPEYDILGRRVVMVAGTLELTTLIFLSALLSLLDAPLSLESKFIVTARDAAFLFFCIISAVLYYQVSTIIIAINGLMSELTRVDGDSEVSDPDSHLITWNNRLARYLKPFILSRDGIRMRLNAQLDQISALSRQLSTEKKRNAQLILLNELSQQLENQLDQPVSAQLAVNTLERALNCSLAGLYVQEDSDQFMLLAAAGPQTNIIPSGYRQNASVGAIGRAVRQRKTQSIDDIRLDKDYILFENEKSLSSVIVPMIFNGHVNGVLTLTNEKANAFGSIEIGLAEAVIEELSRAWERSGYQQRLTNLIQAGSQLSSVLEPESTAREVATIAREILNARFTFVQIQLGQEAGLMQTAASGDAPKLLASLEGGVQRDTLTQAAFHAVRPFRVRDIRKYSTTSRLDIDHPSLRSMLAIPIRWHRLSIGAVLAFGKQNEVFFTENDESLAELLSIQAAGAFESAWLQQELRASLTTTSLLYRLSTQIIQAENLYDAAKDIAQTAHKLARGISTGIVLFSSENEIEAQVEVDATGVYTSDGHPMEMIHQVMESGQVIYISQDASIMRAYLPIHTPIRKYGVLWMNFREDHHHKPANPADLQTLVNQAAIALERSLLLVESRRQAQEIKTAYNMLEESYDQTLAVLTSALDARDSETEGHSLRVSQLVSQLGETLGFSYEQLKALERGSLLHDIGKIGISDSILHKPGPLTEDEWKIMRLHPDIGARIVKDIPFLQDTIPLIRHHQERWNGSGYPLGLKKEEIPSLARIFAVVDAFDALTNDRPYRLKISAEQALKYLRDHAGVLFDPDIVPVFEKLVVDNEENLAVPE